MFKIESYLIPWIVSYLDKYVELKLDDLKLSLWEGDAVLKKLNIRLNVIEELTNFPITFTSGIINELIVHIPWTRITSEAIVITINTIEFVARLKDSNKNAHDSNTRNKSSPSSISNEQIPPIETNSNVSFSYVQNLVNKIVNNIQIVVNNVIVKFCEDDIVLSLSMRSAEYFSVDSSWSKAFLDGSSLDLRKIIQFNDVTLCLDKCDMSGKVVHYQEPVLYRCSIQMRLFTQFFKLTTKKVDTTKIDIFCSNFKMSISDQQLSIITRLIEIFVPVYYKSSCSSRADASLSTNVTRLDNNSSLYAEINEIEHSNQDDGWISWMWSQVPSITNLITDETILIENSKNSKSKFYLGIYFDELNGTFKLTESQDLFASKKITFNPFIIANIKGFCVEISSSDGLLDVILGISEIKIQSVGKCSCEWCSSPCTNEIDLLYSSSNLNESQKFNYLTNSFFKENQEVDVIRPRDRNGQLNAVYGLKRFGALFFQYLTYKFKSIESEYEENYENDYDCDVLSLALVTYNMNVNLSTNFIHRLFKFIEHFQLDTKCFKNTYITDEIPFDSLFKYDFILNDTCVFIQNPLDHINNENNSNIKCILFINVAPLNINLASPHNSKSIQKLNNVSNYLKIESHNLEAECTILRDGLLVDQLKLIKQLSFSYSIKNYSHEPKNKAHLAKESKFELKNLEMALNMQIVMIVYYFFESSMFILNNKCLIEDVIYLKDTFNDVIFNNMRLSKEMIAIMIYNIKLQYSLTSLHQTFQGLCNSLSIKLINDKSKEISCVRLLNNENIEPLFAIQFQAPLDLSTMNNEQIFLKINIRELSIDLVDELLEILNLNLDKSEDLGIQELKLQSSHDKYDDSGRYSETITLNSLDGFFSTFKLAELFYEHVKSINVDVKIHPIRIGFIGNALSSRIGLFIQLPELWLRNSMIRFTVSQNRSVKFPFLIFNIASNESKKLPWEISLANLQVYTTEFEANQLKRLLLDVDFASTLAVTPKYDKSNRISSLSFAFHSDLAKGIELNINKEQLNLILNTSMKLINMVKNFKYKISLPKRNDEEKLINQMSKMDASSGDYADSFTSLTSFDVTNDDKLSRSSRSSAPLKVIVHEKAERRVKLSYWVQITAYKVLINIHDTKNMISLSLEDVSGFLDIHNTHQKIFFKIGNLFLNYNVFKISKWMPYGFTHGILIDSSNRVNQSLFMYDENSTRKIDKPSLGVSTNKTGSVFSITFTRASYKSFVKKLNEFDSQTRGTHFETHSTSDLNEFDLQTFSKPDCKWLNELNINLRCLDLIYHESILRIIFEFSIELVELFTRYILNLTQNSSSINDSTKLQSSYLIPLLRPADVPLVNFDIGYCRLILPLLDSATCPIVVAQCLKLHATSQLDNPINRNIKSSHTIYNKAKSTGALYKPGFSFEDRQYMFNLRGLSVFHSTSSNLTNRHDSYKSNIHSNPAAMWNQIDVHREDPNEATVQIHPIISYFDLDAIIGLPVVYVNHEKRIKSILSGYIIEMNILTENIDLFVKNESLTVICALLNENKKAIDELLKNLKFDSNGSKKNRDELVEQKTQVKIVPLDAFVTLENINIFIFNQIKQQPLFHMHILQPHVCIMIYEKMQKLEVSIHDFYVKESNGSNHECLDYVIETKPGDPNRKTGILQAFFSLKFNNFLSALLNTSVDDQENHSEYLIECNKCTSIYGIISSHNDSNLFEQPCLTITFARPIKFYLKDSAVKKLDEYCGEMKNLISSLGSTHVPRNKKSKSKNSSIPDLRLLTSQLVFSMDIPNIAGSQLEFGWTNACLNFYSSNSNTITKGYSKSKSVDGLACTKLELNEIMLKMNSANKWFFILGPITLNLNLSLFENRYTISAHMNSLNIDISQLVYSNILKLKDSYLSQIFLRNKDMIEEAFKSHAPYDLNRFKLHDDDLRNGSMSYSNNNHKTLEFKICESQFLPKQNQILTDKISICWKYNENRSIIFSKIQPIPFISRNQAKLKCFLECLNPCSNNFINVKEFYLKEECYTTVIDYKASLGQLKSHLDLIYSSTWRIRLSKDAIGILDAETLLASTRVDSIALKQDDLSIKNIEFFVKKIEVKLKNAKHSSDLAIVNLNENKFFTVSSKENDHLVMCNVRALSSLSISFIESRFLTLIPLFENASIKAITNASIDLNENKVDLNLKIKNFDVSISQSLLQNLNRIHKEIKNFTADTQTHGEQHYYLIVNDTDLQLAIKQQNTEESFLIESGKSLEYSWRTHKKSQLLQIYLPKYKTHSKAFSPNNLNVEEISFQLNDQYIKLYVIKEDMNEFHKRLTIQGTLFLCNYLDFDLKINLSLQINNKTHQINCKDIVSGFSRSVSSYHLPYGAIQTLEIAIYNDKTLISNFDSIKMKDLIHGILCESNETKFWLNLHEENLKEYYESESSFNQFNLVFSPMVILCSYSPYNLDMSINSVSNEHLETHKSIQINKISKRISNKSPLLNVDINIEDLKKISLKNLSKGVTYTHKSSQVKSYISSKCYHDNRLFYAQMNEFTSLSESSDLYPKVTIPIIKESNAKLSEKSSQLIDSTQFTIQKNMCWKFSNTIRIDIRPVCLLSNKTHYNIKIQEQIKQHNWAVDSHKEIAFLTNNDVNQKFKFSIYHDGVHFESSLLKISDDSSSPFLYLKESSILYANNWLDLKLMPVHVDSQNELRLVSYLKCIYLTIRSTWSYENEFGTRLITIQPKFFIHNDTSFDFKFQINSLFNEEINIGYKEYCKLPSKSCNSSGEIFDSLTTKTLNSINLSSLTLYQTRTTDFLASSTQSKPILLFESELVYRKYDRNSTFSNRQSFTIYNLDTKLSNGRSFVSTQKLYVDEDGRLEVVIREDDCCVMQIYNSLDVPVWLWPRVVDNSFVSFENLMQEFVSSLNKNGSDVAKALKPKMSCELMLTHLVPPKTNIKLSIELFGTTNYPQNLIDSMHVSFGLHSKNDDLIYFSESCKIHHVEFDFHKDIVYVSMDDDTKSSIRLIKYKEDSIDLKIPISRPLKLSFLIFFETISFTLHDDCQSNEYQTEIIRLTGKNVHLNLLLNLHSNKEQYLSTNIQAQYLQIDNQIYDFTLYDYPVILIPQAKWSQEIVTKNDYQNFSLDDWISSSLTNNFLCFKIDLKRQKFLNDENIMLNSIEFSIKPFEVYIEDRFISDFVEFLAKFLKAITPLNSTEAKVLPANDIQSPIRIKSIKIHQIEANLNLKASIKIYLATNKTPIKVRTFEITNANCAFYSSQQLIKLLTSHYLSSFLYRVGWILGSLDLIGSPSSFLTKISSGIHDLVHLPYTGLRQNGVVGLLGGVKNGSCSLIFNVSAGTITSLTSFASFVSRNMDLLSFDADHLARQEELRHQTQQNGLIQIASSFFVSLIGAVGGLADQPIQSIQHSNSLLKGFSKGLIGLVAKPVGAVAELVNQTGDGFLRATGMKDIPTKDQRLCRPSNKRFDSFQMSSEKFLKKLVSEKDDMNVHSIVEVVFHSTNSEEIVDLKACYLVLVDEIFFVVDKNEDLLHRAYCIGEIDVNASSSVPNSRSNELFKDSILIVTLFSPTIKPFLDQEDLINDRIVDYIHHFNQKSPELNGVSHSFQYNFRYSDRPVLNDELKCPCGQVLLEFNSSTIEPQKKGHRKNQLSESSMSLQLKIHKTHDTDSPTARVSPRNSPSSNSDKTRTQFFFYIDPRVSNHFVCVFQTLKRKYLNKGF